MLPPCPFHGDPWPCAGVALSGLSCRRHQATPRWHVPCSVPGAPVCVCLHHRSLPLLVYMSTAYSCSNHSQEEEAISAVCRLPTDTRGEAAWACPVSCVPAPCVPRVAPSPCLMRTMASSASEGTSQSIVLSQAKLGSCTEALRPRHLGLTLVFVGLWGLPWPLWCVVLPWLATQGRIEQTKVRMPS